MAQRRRIGLPVLAGDAPHEESPAHIEPSTIILSPAGMLTVVPALIISLAPSATVRLPLRFTVPDQVSIDVISPEVVTALESGVKTVDPNNLTWYLINAVQELSAEVEKLKNG